MAPVKWAVKQPFPAKHLSAVRAAVAWWAGVRTHWKEILFVPCRSSTSRR